MRVWLSWAAAVALIPAPGFAETLADALAQAYVKNPTLEAARAAARSADEGFAQARAGFLPQIDLTGEYATSNVDTKTPSVTPGGPATTTTVDGDTSAYGVRAAQEIFTGGRRIGELGRADASIEAAQEGLRSVEQSVLLQAIAVYVDVRRDEEVVRIRSNNLEILNRQLEESNARFEVGDITRTDVAQSQARLSGAQAELVSAQADLEASRARYAAIIGAPPGSLEPVPPAPALPDTIDAAIDEALANNPDYAQLQQFERAAKAQIKVDRSDLLPQVSIVGSLGRENDTPLPGVERDVATASAQLTIPLFEGGFARSRVRQSRIELDRARAETEQVRRGVVADVIAAWNGYNAANRVIDAAREQVKANELAFEGAQQEFQVGLRTTLDVLNAQQELLDSRLLVVRAERDAYVAAHALLQAVGRLDAETLGVNAPLYDPDKHRRAVQWRVFSTEPAPYR